MDRTRPASAPAATQGVAGRPAFRVIPCPSDGPRANALGALLAVARDGRLTELSFCDSTPEAEARGRALPDAVADPDAAPLPAVAAQLADRRQRFDLPLAPAGSDFERRVWRVLERVPWGETRSYGDLARAAGSPGAARAIGGAMHRNPIAVVVPCHRIVGADGSLTGYGAGLERKRALLELEGVLPAEGTLPLTAPGESTD